MRRASRATRCRPSARGQSIEREAWSPRTIARGGHPRAMVPPVQRIEHGVARQVVQRPGQGGVVLRTGAQILDLDEGPVGGPVGEQQAPLRRGDEVPHRRLPAHVAHQPQVHSPDGRPGAALVVRAAPLLRGGRQQPRQTAARLVAPAGLPAPLRGAVQLAVEHLVQPEPVPWLTIPK